MNVVQNPLPPVAPFLCMLINCSLMWRTHNPTTSRCFLVLTSPVTDEENARTTEVVWSITKLSYGFIFCVQLQNPPPLSWTSYNLVIQVKNLVKYSITRKKVALKSFGDAWNTAYKELSFARYSCPLKPLCHQWSQGKQGVDPWNMSFPKGKSDWTQQPGHDTMKASRHFQNNHFPKKVAPPAKPSVIRDIPKHQNQDLHPKKTWHIKLQ